MSVVQALGQYGVATFEAELVKSALSSDALAEFEAVTSSFGNLVRDQHMGDGGRYRFRRYSRFAVDNFTTGQLNLRLLPGRTILQAVKDNPLNGGVKRTFEPLEKSLLDGFFLPDLIRHDMAEILKLEASFFAKPVHVGVHQVRIVAYPNESGNPTPEGVHRDAERYTFQHFWAREGVSGGEFSAYDEARRPVFSWLQETPLDSLLFLGSTWHSASPINCLEGRVKGWRDIFLIDFDREEEAIPLPWED